MSLMGIVMMVGIVVSNSILIVEFTHRLINDEGDGHCARPSPSACRVRLRPILMTSLATVFGLVPMALKLGTGSEVLRPAWRVPSSAALAYRSLSPIFLVPAAMLVVYRNGATRRASRNARPRRRHLRSKPDARTAGGGVKRVWISGSLLRRDSVR